MDSVSKGKIQPRNADRGLGLRPLTTNDIPAIQALASQSFDVIWRDVDFKYFITNPCGKNLGVFLEEKLLGYVLSLLVAGDLDIVSLAILPERRREGLAKRLLNELLSDKGVDRAYLEVESENTPAILFYENRGFTRYGLRKKYYQGKKDAVLMRHEVKTLA